VRPIAQESQALDDHSAYSTAQSTSTNRQTAVDLSTGVGECFRCPDRLCISLEFASGQFNESCDHSSVRQRVQVHPESKFVRCIHVLSLIFNRAAVQDVTIAWTACSGSDDRSIVFVAASENLLSQTRSKYSDCERERSEQDQGPKGHRFDIPVSRPLLCELQIFCFHK